MELLKSLGTGLRSILRPRDAHKVEDSRVPTPDRFPEGSRFYIYARTRSYAFIPGQGWFKVGLKYMSFIQEQKPSWPDTFAESLDDGEFRQRLSELYRRKVNSWDLHREFIKDRHFSLWELAISKLPPVPDTFPEGTQLWEHESLGYIFLPGEGWFQADADGLVFYDDGEIPLHVRTYGIRLNEEQFRLLLKGELKYITYLGEGQVSGRSDV